VILISLKSIPVFMLWLRYLSVFQPIGILVIMIQEMVTDVLTFFTLGASVTLGFSLCLAGLQASGHLEDPKTGPIEWQSSHSGLFTPLWAIFGYFNPTHYDSLVAILVWTYILIGSVVLVNLLVAMFADTFSRIKKESEEEYIHLKCSRMFFYRHVVPSIPPIINTPNVLYHHIVNLIHILVSSGRRLLKMRKKVVGTLKRESSSVDAALEQIVKLQRQHTVAAGDMEEPVQNLRSKAAHSEHGAAAILATAATAKDNEDHLHDSRNLVERYLQHVARLASETVHAVTSESRDEMHLLSRKLIDDFGRVSSQMEAFEARMDRKFVDEFGRLTTRMEALEASIDRRLRVLESTPGSGPTAGVNGNGRRT